MIIWGSGSDAVGLGYTETHPCATCEKDRPFNLLLQYRYFHLYWLFGMVTEKKYLLVCEVCRRGWELEKEKVGPVLQEVRIPFMRRYGLAVLALIVVLFFWWV